MKSAGDLGYVLVTPARNEETYIEATIRSVVAQTILPKKWIIVSDGSTDRTDEIARQYAEKHDWISFKRMPDHADRHFASKVFCFNSGYQAIKSLDFDIIGNLDADLSFEADYFEYLLDKFSRFPNLGVAGTPFIEDATQHYDYRFTNIEHVSGACQLFRRNCFEAIGGYMPIKGGGIDWVAVTMARMKGWETRTFTDKSILHHRKMGTGKGNMLSAAFSLGQQDYYLGNHPLWESFRMIYQMKSKPYIIGGMFLFIGFAYASAKRIKRPIPSELVAFFRKEQMKRLSSLIRLKKWRNGANLLGR